MANLTENDIVELTKAKMLGTSALMDRLSIRIETKREDIIALTQELIRIPTINPPGDLYRDICEYLHKRLSGSGFQTELVRAYGSPGDSDKYPRWNIVARRDGTAPGDCVHFNSHTDVVEVGQGWTFDPFGGELSDGKIYGRGACDMKGGLATSIIAAEAFLEEFPNFSGAIEISGTADEESGGFGGVAYLAEKGYFSPEKVQHVIIPEPLQKDRICLGHRGVYWAEIETHGEIAHGSMPFLGDCAVRHMGAVVQKMETSLFPALALKHTVMPVVPEGAKQSTLNINSFHGGQAEPEPDFTGLPSPCVPDSCRMIVDRRYLIEESYDDVKAELVDVLEEVASERDGFRYDVREIHSVVPTMTKEDAPVVTSIGNGIQAILGKQAEHVVSPGTYDQKHIDRIGRLKNCVAYGPGVLEMAHKPDEFIGVNDMIDSAKVMGHALIEILKPKQ